MVAFGTIHDWRPAPGRVVSWAASEASVAAAYRAPVCDVPPIHQQREHLQNFVRHREAGRDMARLCFGTWTVAGTCDIPAMTTAINAHLRRHDAYHSWFSFTDGAEQGSGTVVRRHLEDPGTVEFVATDHGVLDADGQRAHLLYSVPDPLRWDCFAFGVVQRDDCYSVYVAVDHLVSDGMSIGVIFAEIHYGYLAVLAGSPMVLPPPGSYLAHSAEVAEFSTSLTAESDTVARWIDFADLGGGVLPDFPLPLGVTEAPCRGAMRQIPLLDADAVERFEAACTAAGARFSGGVYAAAALVEHELTGLTCYRGMAPFDTRRTPQDQMTPGWFASFIPVTAPVGDLSFAEVAAAAQQSLDAAKPLGAVPFARVVELAAPGRVMAPERDVPLLSFIDIRKMPFSEQWDDMDAGVYGDSRLSEQVCLWVNRFAASVTLTISFPDNPIAHASVQRYTDALVEVYRRIAASSVPAASAPSSSHDLADVTAGARP